MICTHVCPSQESANEGWFWQLRVSTGRGDFRVGPVGDAGDVIGDAGNVAGDVAIQAQGWEISSLLRKEGVICLHLCPSQESANEGWF